ncbi:hypothetical protein CWI37_2857p0010 [Hamiltosporidium tvaerminnensis]|uniref:Uncharacterized protein n=1 Tax=Hamiltosporidium tvaerminnensis TaxID=1176355 RepID=A0A4Q9KPU3_9MICR|nr:hypothetical protein CWI37_2857p0010 [Hamiltosporidium tvaerminnensis]
MKRLTIGLVNLQHTKKQTQKAGSQKWTIPPYLNIWLDLHCEKRLGTSNERELAMGVRPPKDTVALKGVLLHI